VEDEEGEEGDEGTKAVLLGERLVSGEIFRLFDEFAGTENGGEGEAPGNRLGGTESQSVNLPDATNLHPSVGMDVASIIGLRVFIH
jgi:hypothetical protein